MNPPAKKVIVTNAANTSGATGSTSARQLETDYLVVGAGAMGLAFVDELIERDPSAQILIVDRRAKPGGHWNDAYAFVSLHQPAAYYGVNSLPLGHGGAALASGDEVLAYFGEVLRRLLASGRVHHYSMCEYEGEGRLRSLTAPDKVYQVRVRRKVVDATYMNVEVPATTPPKYAVASSVTLVPVNGLVDLRAPRSGYVIIGAGKTGIDAVLFLLGQGVDPDDIRWIVSNDAWFLRRERIQPGLMLELFYEQVEIFSRSDTLDDVIQGVESAGIFCRLDTSIEPTKFRCATVSGAELEQLRRVHDVVRLGRVVRIDDDTIVLDRGDLATDPGKLYVDCTADGLAKRPVRPVFDGPMITLQSLLMCQQVFSAALIAYLETNGERDANKNALAQVVPHPEWTRDYVATQLVSMANLEAWSGELRPWLMRSRLSFLHHESKLDLLITGLRLERIKSAVDKRLRRIYAEEFLAAEPEPEPIELEHGPLRFTAHVAGMHHSKERPLVLCLHGFPDNARSFRMQLPILAAEGYRVVAPTMRGYEPSSQPSDNDYSIAALAEDVIAWLDHLGEDEVHLVGHDWGAIAAYAAGALAPERFRSLTTVAVPHLARFLAGVLDVPSQVAKSWYILFLQLPGVAEHVIERNDWALVRRLWSQWSPEFRLPPDEWASLRATFEAPGVKRAMLSYYRQNLSPRAVFEFDASDTIVRVPTLAITGADDGCVDTRLFDHLFSDGDFPRGVRVDRIRGAGHFVHQEQPEMFNRVLLDWLGAH